MDHTRELSAHAVESPRRGAHRNEGFIYKDRIGHIKGWYDWKKGLWFVTEFLVYPKHRGKGNARKLAEHLPKRCYLFCCPLVGIKRGPHVPLRVLVAFYSSLGFSKQPHDNSAYMERR